MKTKIQDIRKQLVSHPSSFYKVAVFTVSFLSLVVMQGCRVHYVQDVPIATVEVRPMMPYAGAVWIDGGWGWSGGRHTQLMGHWDHPRSRPDRAGEWRHNDRGHYYVRGNRR